mgnify:CR=1 FL=1
MENVIRKIVVGKDPKNGMAYYVGKTRYLVYLDTDDTQVLWKSIDEMPCMLEFDCNF